LIFNNNYSSTTTGIGRGWWAPGTLTTGWSTLVGQEEQIAPTFLGAYFDNVSVTNGVIFQVNNNTAALAAFDLRELGGAGYSRIQVPISSITPVDGGPALSSGDTVWFYNVIQSLLSVPTEAAPIVESYVDLILTACLAIDATINPGYTNFTTDFVKTTQAWSPYWVNDRLLPRRPWVYQSNAATIDSILAANIPAHILLNITYDNPGVVVALSDFQLLQKQVISLQSTISTLQSSVATLKSKSNGGSRVNGFGVLLVFVFALFAIFNNL